MSTSSWCSQASGPWADVVRGAIEVSRLEAREPAGVRLGGGGDAVPAGGRAGAGKLATSEQVFLDLSGRRLGQLCDHLDDVGHHEPWDAPAQGFARRFRLH